MNLKFLLLILSSIILKVSSECGYPACPKTDPNKINIHLIAHSHDDVGWLKTVDGYYEDDVRSIITNYVKSLRLHDHRRFTQVETYYFNRWWHEQNDEVKNAVKELVNSGRLVFTNGGWCVNDEGAAFYNNIIDQMTLGLRTLDDIFGKCAHPRTSWQIDPFGHSKEMASLFAQMGFDGHVTNRGVHPKGEFIWRGSHDLGEKSDIFTSELHEHYDPPNGFNFENGNDITDGNKNDKARIFTDIARRWNNDYGKTGHVMMTMGTDFQYRNAERWFSNMDKLIDVVTHNHNDIHIFYSTPNCYFYSINQLNRTFEHRDVDYLTYWVGYYSNRPTLKRDDRMHNNLLQACKQLDAFAQLNTTKEGVNEARNEEAILQHHDAITGTSPQKTADDYAHRLFSGVQSCDGVVDKTYKKLMPKDQKYDNNLKQVFCNTLNISACGVSESSNNFAVTIYNSIGRKVSQWVRIPVGNGNYNVSDPEGKNVNAYLVPIPDNVKNIPGRKSTSNNELVFKVNIPALGFGTYFVKKSQYFSLFAKSSYKNNNREKRASIHKMKGKGFTLNIDESSGEIQSIDLENGSKNVPLKQSFMYYKSVGGHPGYEDSGSYQFCPEGNAVHLGNVKLVSKFDNGMIHEVRQQWNDWASQTIRVYEDEEYVEFDWTVEHIPTGDGIGKEIITRFETNLHNDMVFYTDANGRQMVKRRRDPKAQGCTQNNITANWYPIYSRIFIRDESKNLQLTVMNDRTQGGSSIIDGSVELMVHRRETHDGAGGPFKIDETGVDGKGLAVRGTHYMFIKSIKDSPQSFRDMGQRLFMEPIISFSQMSESENEYKNKYTTLYSALNKELPPNVHLLTLENWKKNQLLLRLEHFYESADNSELSKPVDVNLENLFKPFKISDITETTLTATEKLTDVKKLNWRSKSFVKRAANLNIHLTSQQIRTFIVDIEEPKNVEEHCDLSWKKYDNSIPTNAIIGGYDLDKSTLYICRKEFKGDLLPGKSNKGLGCDITYGGAPHKYPNDYEILVGSNVNWIPRHGGDPVPGNAFVAGKSADGQNIYIGRCTINHGRGDTQVPGKIHHWFYYEYDNTEQNDCINHEVLIC